MSDTACPECGAEWPADLDLEFCGKCATELDASAPEITDRERRTLTVLFADLSGFTTFSEGRDPETVEATVDALFADLGAVVEDYGGYVDKYLGDAVMAVFGAPEAHEDDPLRAVRAGFELLEAVDEFNDEHGEDLALSVGINHGEVVWSQVGGGDYTVTGDAVNVAQRLESAADPGTVLVSRTVEERTDDQVRYERLPELTVEGRDESVEPAVAEALREDASPGTTNAEVRIPLVGRDAELDELLAHCEASDPRFVTVVGEAGIGKSRLLEAVRERLADHADDPLVLRGYCREHTDLPYEPFGDVLLSRAGTGRGDPAAGRRVVETVREDLQHGDRDPTRRENVAHLLAIAAGLEVPDAGVTDMPAERVREETHLAWLDWLEHLAADRPVVLQIEDLQWADGATRELLAFLQERLAGDDGSEGASVTLLASSRPGGDVPEWFEVLELDALSATDTRGIAEAVLEATVDDDLAAYLHGQAGGNPYFVVELLRYLLEGDLLAETGGEYRLGDGSIEETTVPESLEGLLVGRIDALEPGPRETLKGASVVGERFWVGLLGDVLEYDVHGAVETLVDREMVRPREESTLPGDREYAFEHALLREAAYELLPSDARQELHAEASAAIEAIARESSPPNRAALTLAARHAEDAGEFERAVSLRRAVADRASEENANHEAIDHYERAVALAREHDLLEGTELAALQADLAKVYERTGALDDARETVQKGLAVASGGSRMECRLLDIRASIQIEQGEFDDAKKTARRQREVATALGAHELKVDALRQLGWVAFCLAEVDRSHDYLEEGLSIAREAGDRSREADHLVGVGNVHWRRGAYDRARECYEESLAIRQETGQRHGEATSLNNLGLVARAQGAYDEARGYYEKSLAIRRAIGDRHGEAQSLTNLGAVLRSQGAYDRAHECYESALAISRDIGDRQLEAANLTNLGIVARAQGDYDRASEYYEKSLAISRDIGDRQLEATNLTYLGMVARAEGNHDEARRRYERGMSITRDIESADDEIRSLCELGALARERRRYDDARTHLDRAMELCEASDDPSRTAEVRLERGRLALAREEPERAGECVRQARETFADIGERHDRAVSRRLLGRIAAAENDPETAREHWRTAIETFVDLDAYDDALRTLEHLVETCREQGDEDAARRWCRRASELLAEAPDATRDLHREWVRDAAEAHDVG